MIFILNSWELQKLLQDFLDSNKTASFYVNDLAHAEKSKQDHSDEMLKKLIYDFIKSPSYLKIKSAMAESNALPLPEFGPGGRSHGIDQLYDPSQREEEILRVRK